MPVCVAMGANARVCIKEETAYGVPPGGTYTMVPIISATLGGTEDVDRTTVLGFGNDPQRPTRNGINAAGDIVVPLDVDAVGYWLKAAFGPATVTGTGTLTHVFKSGAQVLPSFSIEIAQLDVPVPYYSKYPGCMVNTVRTAIGPDGRPQATLGIIAADEIEDNVSISGSPVVPAPNYFQNKNGSLTKDGTAAARIVNLNLTLNNNIATTKFAGGGGKIGCADKGQFEATGSIDVRTNDLAYALLAQNATLSDIAFGWTAGINSLFMELDAADLFRNGNPLAGPGPRQRTFNVEGSRDAAEGMAFHATLINTHAAY
jgi:hypothetical protein